MKNDEDEYDLLDISRDDIVPYFMWDYQYSVGEIKKMLAEDDENQRLWLMAKIMRDARYSDVWKFISLIKISLDRRIEAISRSDH